jgi:hypothetical protein
MFALVLIAQAGLTSIRIPDSTRRFASSASLPSKAVAIELNGTATP